VRRRLVAAAAGLAVTVPLGLLVGCGSEADNTSGTAAASDPGASGESGESGEEAEEKGGEELEGGADLTTCVADVTDPVTDLPAGIPGDWPWPPRTAVFAAEDRGEGGVVVSAVSASPFSDVLDFLNGDVAAAGYRVTSGETEELVAEADWSGGGFRGRWAIRESASCPGETTIQVLSTAD
jgi:hypothetical protein